MPTVTKQIEIDAPTDRVWAVLSDFGGVYKWNPTVTHSSLIADQSTGVDAQRTCTVAGFGDIRERATAWEAGKSLSVEISGAPMLKRATGTVEIEARGDTTVVTMRVDYQTSWGPIGALMGATIMKRKLGQTLEQALAGLRHHVLTGEEVGTEVPKLLPA